MAALLRRIETLNAITAQVVELIKYPRGTVLNPPSSDSPTYTATASGWPLVWGSAKALGLRQGADKLGTEKPISADELG